MSAEWPMVPLGELTVNLDARRKPVKEPDRKAGPYPYYGASGIVDYVDGYLFDGEHLLIAEDGENLRTRQLPIAFMAKGKFWVNNHAHIVVGNEKADTRYLMYAMQSTDISGYLTGAVMPKLTQGNLNRIPLPCPPVDIQLDIVRILGDLDEKIELNRQINQTLEQIAQTIFKSWFVDFEPVKAKIEAKAAGLDPERAAMCAISGKLESELDQLPAEQYQQLAATAALFPDELVESELALIPEGWAPQRLEKLLELSYGKALTKTERKDGDYPVYGSGGITGCHDRPLVSGPGIIVGRKGTVGALYWEDRDFFAIDTVFYVEPKNGATLEVLFYLLQILGLEKMNTDAAVPGLNRNNVYRLPVPKYPNKLMEAFSETVGAVREKIFCGLGEIETLATVRDTLLPKLLTGKIEIR